MIISPWLLAVTLVVGTATVSVFGLDLVLPIGVAVFAYLGQNDWIGPL